MTLLHPPRNTQAFFGTDLQTQEKAPLPLSKMHSNAAKACMELSRKNPHTLESNPTIKPRLMSGKCLQRPMRQGTDCKNPENAKKHTQKKKLRKDTGAQ